MASNEGGDRLGEVSTKKIVGFAGLIVLVALAGFGAFFFSTMFRYVGVGYAMILVDPWAKTVSDPTLGPAWVVKAPWVSAVKIFYATDTFEDVVPCFSSDQLEMEIEILIRWSLDPNKIKDLYKSYPRVDYKDKAIDSIMEETIRIVTKNYTALETIEQRDLVMHQIEQSLFEGLREEPSLVEALMHLEFDLKNIGYPGNYTRAIEEKLVREQQMIQAEFERNRILVLANATAQQAIIEAHGEAEAKIIVAEGTKAAIDQIVSVTGITNATRIAELYLTLEALKSIAKDTGQMIVFLMMGEGQVPILYPINP